jgi:hypothetical protein
MAVTPRTTTVVLFSIDLFTSDDAYVAGIIMTRVTQGSLVRREAFQAIQMAAILLFEQIMSRNVYIKCNLLSYKGLLANSDSSQGGFNTCNGTSNSRGKPEFGASDGAAAAS